MFSDPNEVVVDLAKLRADNLQNTSPFVKSQTWLGDGLLTDFEKETLNTQEYAQMHFRKKNKFALDPIRDRTGRRNSFTLSYCAEDGKSPLILRAESTSEIYQSHTISSGIELFIPYGYIAKVCMFSPNPTVNFVGSVECFGDPDMPVEIRGNITLPYRSSIPAEGKIMHGDPMFEVFLIKTEFCELVEMGSNEVPVLENHHIVHK